MLNTGVGFTFGVTFVTIFGELFTSEVIVELTTVEEETCVFPLASEPTVVIMLDVQLPSVLFLNCGIGCTVYFCVGILGGSLIALSALAWSLLSRFSELGLGELNCFVKGNMVNGICLILGLVGHEDPCFILGELGTDEIIILGDVGPGDRFVGERGLDFGIKITDAKESSESTLVSLCKLLSFDESEPSSFECLLSQLPFASFFSSNIGKGVLTFSTVSSSGIEGDNMSDVFQF